MKKKVAALVSGGVDSSVALNLLSQHEDLDITAFYLKIWLDEELQFLGECPWQEDIAYAEAVCDSLGVKFEVVSLQDEYWDRVVSQTVDELKKGRTPSPDILCNQKVKFGAFLEIMGDQFDYVATGHYATVKRDDSGFYRLFKGVDPVKDQTYFLSRLSQEQLAKCLFPIGTYPKSEVRRMADDMNLPNKDRPDSQGICFLGKIKFNDFVAFHLGEKMGAIIEKDTGKKLGLHKGFWFHTIGQRRGLGLSGGPWFVVGKDCVKNEIYVSSEENFKIQPQLEFKVKHVSWIHRVPDLSETLSVKIRHGQRVNSCRIEKIEHKSDEYLVSLSKADGGIAPGQYAVFYDSEECLGAGLIS